MFFISLFTFCCYHLSKFQVLFDEDNARRIWYSAKVLSLKDGKAYVNYNDFPANAGKPREPWLPRIHGLSVVRFIRFSAFGAC